MGKNKLAKFAEIATFKHVFQVPSHFIRSGNSFSLQGKWGKDFFGNDHPIILELGCGKGEYTVNMAEQYPDKNFIAVDIKGARIWTGAKDSWQKGLKNVAFLRTDIEMIQHFFGENEVSEIWLTFPDPQMKKTTKRLTATNFIDSYLKFLKPDNIIHLKTDSNFLYSYTFEMVKANEFPVLYQTRDLYAAELIDPVLDIKTHYEKQWLERGLAIKYIKFTALKHKTLVEPDVEIEYDSYRSYGRNKTQHIS